MLSNIGDLEAALQLVSPTKNVIESVNFVITVKKSIISETTTQSSDRFTALNTAIVKLNSWNANIGTVEQKIIDHENNIDVTYPMRLLSVETSLADIAINVEHPPAPLVACVGDGRTDDTMALQAIINKAIQDNLILFAPNQYLISDTLLFSYINGESFFKMFGRNGGKVKFLAKMVGKPAIKLLTTANGLFKNGIELGEFDIEPFFDDYRQKFDGIELANTTGVVLNKIAINGCENGLTLKAEGIGAYTEQNSFNDVLIQDCINAITFRVDEIANWNSSFHGNIFDKVSISTESTSAIGGKAVAINIEGGHIYNCLFTIKVFIAGDNAYLFDINGSSGTNYGSISYEVFSIYPCKIKTGDNALANFFLNGSIHGFNDVNTLDWSEYHPITVGDLDYDNAKMAIDSSYAKLGSEKFYVSNLFPPKELANVQLWSGVPVLDPLINNLDDLWQGKTNMLTRYHNKDGNEESGFLMACREVAGAGSRLILGYIPSDKKSINDFVPGFYIMSDGSTIKSVSKGSQISFNSTGVSIYGDTINLPLSKTPTSATAPGNTGDICWDGEYIYICVYTNMWKRAPMTTW